MNQYKIVNGKQFSRKVCNNCKTPLEHWHRTGKVPSMVYPIDCPKCGQSQYVASY